MDKPTSTHILDQIILGHTDTDTNVPEVEETLMDNLDTDESVEVTEDMEVEAYDSEDSDYVEDEDESAVQEDEDETSHPSKIKIELDDEVLELDQRELKDHVLRQKDYTRKTQELAKERKEVTEQRQSLVQNMEEVHKSAQYTFKFHEDRLNEMNKAIELEGGIEAAITKYGPEKVQEFIQAKQEVERQVNYTKDVIEKYKPEIEKQNRQLSTDALLFVAGKRPVDVRENVEAMDRILKDAGITEDSISMIQSPELWEALLDAAMYRKSLNTVNNMRTSSKQKPTNLNTKPKQTVTKTPDQDYKKLLNKASKAPRSEKKVHTQSILDAIINKPKKGK